MIKSLKEIIDYLELYLSVAENNEKGKHGKRLVNYILPSLKAREKGYFANVIPVSEPTDEEVSKFVYSMKFHIYESEYDFSKDMVSRTISWLKEAKK